MLYNKEIKESLYEAINNGIYVPMHDKNNLRFIEPFKKKAALDLNLDINNPQVIKMALYLNYNYIMEKALILDLKNLDFSELLLKYGAFLLPHIKLN